MNSLAQKNSLPPLQMTVYRLGWIGKMAALVFIAGCGSSIHVVPASGTITLDGQPLADVEISTQPVETEGSTTNFPGSFGRTDANGRFTLELQTGEDTGAVVGKHAVYISFGGDPTHPDNASKPQIPTKYWDGSTRCTVPEGGTDELNFTLLSK